MAKKWNSVEIKNIRNEKTEMKDYQQTVEEIAAIVYSGLCQLQKGSSSDSLASNNNLERTGSDV